MLRACRISCVAVLGAVAAGLICGSLAGCNRQPYRIVPVKGRITLNGKPQANIQVTFQPVSMGKQTSPGPGSYGLTDADGRFALRTVNPDLEGAVVGDHFVTLARKSAKSKVESDTSSPVDRTIPQRYRTGEAVFTVPPEGSDAADFELGKP